MESPLETRSLKTLTALLVKAIGRELIGSKLGHGSTSENRKRKTSVFTNDLGRTASHEQVS
jgi:hypothetical protein